MSDIERIYTDLVDLAYVRTENSFPSVSGWYKKFDWGTGIDQALVVAGAP